MQTNSSGALRRMLQGAAAGAAGTTALNVVTHLDMAVRARPASSTPETTVLELVKRAGVEIPGDEASRSNRLEALGALSGLGAGVAVGMLLGAVQAAGWRPGRTGAFAAATAAALLAGNGPMTVLGVTDPRTWDATAWASDLVPHVAYGAVAAYVLTSADDR